MEAAEEYKTALKHIAELYTFLGPVLPTVDETQRTIDMYRKEGQTIKNTQDQEDFPSEEITDEEEVQEQEQETEEDEQETEDDEDNEENDHDTEPEKEVRFNMGHLTDEEQVEEEKRVEADISVQIQETTSEIPDNRMVPTPGVEPPKPVKKKEELVLRQPRRGGRERTKTKRFWDRK